MEAPAALGPAVAEVGVLVDVSLVQVDQLALIPLGCGQQGPDLFDEHRTPLAAGAAEQLSSLFPRQAKPVQRGTDRLAAARPAKPVAHEACQALERPARRRVGPG